MCSQKDSGRESRKEINLKLSRYRPKSSQLNWQMSTGEIVGTKTGVGYEESFQKENGLQRS